MSDLRQEPGLIDGVMVRIAGQNYLLPPLNLKQIKKYAPVLEGLRPDLTSIDAIVDVVHASMSRNYPDITKEQLEEMLDLGNVKVVLEAVTSASGLVVAPQGELNMPEDSAASTGAMSTDTSLPQLVGRGKK